MANNLIPLDKKQPADLFVSGGLQPLLEAVEQEALSLSYDVGADTAKGRKELASIARKVASSKTAIDAVGKEHVAEAKKEIKKVDQERKRARDFLDDLRDNIRAPVTEFENAEKARVQAHKDRIQEMRSLAQQAFASEDTNERKTFAVSLDDLANNNEWEEFDEEAAEAYKESRSVIERSIKTSEALAEAAEAKRQAEVEAEVQRRLREEDKEAAIEPDMEPEPEQNVDKVSRPHTTERMLQARVHREIAAALDEMAGCSGKDMVRAIYNGEIPHVSINYDS